MSIKYVLLDLDGTLLEMNQDEFVNGYFKLLAKKLSAYGYEPQELIKSVWSGTKAMVTNDGSQTNKEAFWNDFAKHYGKDSLKDIPKFDEFYENEFENARIFCRNSENACRAIKELKSMNIKLVLATNPLFPKSAVIKRLGWASLSVDDFIYYTSYENSTFSKPDIRYYSEIAEKIGANCDECLMVGNDTIDDMSAKNAGMNVFLLTDCLVNKEQKDINEYPNGSFSELIKYVKENI